MNAIQSAYERFCKKRFPLPSEQQVAALERRIGVSLPEDYRRYILEFNGGWFTEPDIVPPIKECPLDCLDFMNGIAATHPCAELASAADLALFTDNDPIQLLPIGYTSMGHLIWLSTHPDDRGRIGLKKCSSDESFFLAKSIEGFFALVQEPSDE
jgi:SMI1/KNR4 family protein SUKH-1